MAIKVPVYTGSGLKLTGYADYVNDGPAKMTRDFYNTAGTLLAFNTTLNVTDIALNSSNQLVVTATEGTLLIQYWETLPFAFSAAAADTIIDNQVEDFSTFLAAVTPKVSQKTGEGLGDVLTEAI